MNSNEHERAVNGNGHLEKDEVEEDDGIVKYSCSA
jgi:hypothetical protein